MLTQPTIEKLCAMRLKGMAEAFRQQQESADCQQLSFEERLGLLIDRQWTWRENHALDRRLRNGRLQGPACIEDIDYRSARGLDRQLVRSLTLESVWVREHQNLFLLGPTGIGKTWLGRAFAQKACRDGYTALFYKAVELFRDLAMARADGRHGKLLYQHFKVWDEVGPPKGTVYNYPIRKSHGMKAHMAAFPAPTDIAVQIYNRATMPTMFAKLQSGQSIPQVIAWAKDELEGFTR